MEKIKSAGLVCRREPLNTHFGFKGGALTELWQVCCQLETDGGNVATGQSVQSVLWSDSAVFAQWGQDGGNEIMLALTRFALELLPGIALEPPPRMLEQLLPAVLKEGRKRTGQPNLRPTFALNALVGVDWALWKLYRLAQGSPDFAALTAPFTAYLGGRQPALGAIPLISYDTGEEQVLTLAKQGCFLFKIKIGSNPGGRNDPREMLEWDIQRLARLHRLLSTLETPWTKSGRPAYYLDANGRYDTRQRLTAFLEAADKMGALEHILLLEEPFPEDRLQDVSGLPVTVAGDESAHSPQDAALLMDQLGYQAMALKPIAKTVSVSLGVLEEAGKRGLPCFCADLTVNPTMVELNKRFAAGLAPLPGLKRGVFETNGAQNYRNWQALCRESPAWGEPWTIPEGGLYPLNDRYYQHDGGIWRE